MLSRSDSVSIGTGNAMETSTVTSAKVSRDVFNVASKRWVEQVLLRLHAAICAAVFNWKAWVQE